MFRISLIAVAFLGVTVVLVLMQPQSPSFEPVDFGTDNFPEVTRAQTNLDQLTVTLDDPGEATTNSAPGNPDNAGLVVPGDVGATGPSDTLTDDVNQSLGQVTIRALQQGQSGAYIDALVNDAAANRIYVVSPGDTLSSISYRFYGRTDAHDAIYSANRGIMTSPNQITVGMQLTIPAP